MGPITLTSKIIGMALTALGVTALIFQALCFVHLIIAGSVHSPRSTSSPSLKEFGTAWESIAEVLAWLILHLTIHQLFIPISFLAVGLYLLRDRNLLIRMAAPRNPINPGPPLGPRSPAVVPATPAAPAAHEPDPDYSKYAPKS